MYIVNVTFLVAPADLDGRIEFLKTDMIPSIFVTPAVEARLMIVVDVLGSPDFSAHDKSLPLQITFRSEEDRQTWMDMVMMPALAEYYEKFGEKGLVMVSLLDDLETEP